MSLVSTVVAIAIVGTLIVIAANITSAIAVWHLINGTLAVFVPWSRPTTLLYILLWVTRRVSALEVFRTFLVEVFNLNGACRV